MPYIQVDIKGIPYPQNRPPHLNRLPLRKWTKQVKEQTQNLPKVRGPCLLRVTFFLRPNQFPYDCPYGTDLDNLLKRFLDALTKTVFSSKASGKDSCVVIIEAMKVRAEKDDEDGIGAKLEIQPINGIQQAAGANAE